MNIKDLVIWKRLRKWRSDKVLVWVKPATGRYAIIVWRRVNPRYAMSGGDFDGINEFQFVEVSYARTSMGAIICQAMLGRDKWTDGFTQQYVEIVEPGKPLNTTKPPLVSFDDYPMPERADLIPNDK